MQLLSGRMNPTPLAGPSMFPLDDRMCFRLLGVWERHIAWKPPRRHSHDDEGTIHGRRGDVRGTVAGSRRGDHLGNWNHQDLTPRCILFLNWSRPSNECTCCYWSLAGCPPSALPPSATASWTSRCYGYIALWSLPPLCASSTMVLVGVQQ